MTTRIITRQQGHRRPVGKERARGGEYADCAAAQGFTDKSPAIGFDAGQGGEQETGFDLAGVAGQPDDVSVYDSRFVPHFGLISSQQVN